VAFVEDYSFCFDNGATSHILPVKADFVDLNSIAPRSIQGVNRITILAIGIGLVKVRCRKGRRNTLGDVLYVPHATLRLISIGRLGDKGYTMLFDAKCCHVMNSNKTLTQGTREEKSLYKLLGDTCTMEYANIA